MQNVSAAWLMVGLGGSPLQVSLVQGAMSLSVLVGSLPAGAFADLHDRRRIMLGSLVGLMLTTGLTGSLALLDRLNPTLLLGLTFMFGLSAALMTPAMQSLLPQLISREELPHAVTLNSVSSSASRSVGPAFAGILISAIGAGASLIANVMAFFGLWLVIARWRHTNQQVSAENGSRQTVAGALVEGVRFALANQPFRSMLLRSLSCFLGSSAILALLPSIVVDRFHDGPAAGARHLGFLLSCYGVGSVAGSLCLTFLTRAINRDALVLLATAVGGCAMLAMAVGTTLTATSIALVIAGMCWTIAMTCISISAQLLLPGKFLARGLSISMTALMAATAIGSVIWGAIATHFSLNVALIAAAITSAVAALMHWIWNGKHTHG